LFKNLTLNTNLMLSQGEATIEAKCKQCSPITPEIIPATNLGSIVGPYSSLCKLGVKEPQAVMQEAYPGNTSVLEQYKFRFKFLVHLCV
jgi:hypothetical protein